MNSPPCENFVGPDGTFLKFEAEPQVGWNRKEHGAGSFPRKHQNVIWFIEFSCVPKSGAVSQDG